MTHPFIVVSDRSCIEDRRPSTSSRLQSREKATARNSGTEGGTTRGIEKCALSKCQRPSPLPVCHTSQPFPHTPLRALNLYSLAVSHLHRILTEDEIERRDQLLSDPTAVIVHPARMTCTRCKAYIVLTRGMKYDLAKWKRHVERCKKLNDKTLNQRIKRNEQVHSPPSAHAPPRPNTHEYSPTRLPSPENE